MSRKFLLVTVAVCGMGVEPEAGAGVVVYIFVKEWCFRKKTECRAGTTAKG